MLKNKTMKLVTSGIFVAIGVIFPFFTGHAFGIPGTILLPMHIPVLIAGFLLGPLYGLAVGVLTPILSSLLTGMPPLFPMLPVMIMELGVYAFVAGYLRRNLKFNLYGTLIISMVAGRLINGLVFSALIAGGLNLAVPTMISSVTVGLPGILIQLAFIPVVVRLLENALGIKGAAKAKKLSPVMETAIKEISSGNITIALIKNGEIVYRSSGPGVRPFLVLLETEEGRELLKGAVVVDKLIGKGAAMLAVLGEAASVYGVTMSESGKAFLKKHSKFEGHTRCIEVISNRQRDGICPIEKSVRHTEDPETAYGIIKETVKQLMAKKVS